MYAFVLPLLIHIEVLSEAEEEMDAMCNMGEAWFKEGKAKGKAEGIKIGEKIGEKKGIVKGLLRAVISNVKHYGVTTEQAMANLGIPENERGEYREMLEKMPEKEGLNLT